MVQGLKITSSLLAKISVMYLRHNKKLGVYKMHQEIKKTVLLLKNKHSVFVVAEEVGGGEGS